MAPRPKSAKESSEESVAAMFVQNSGMELPRAMMNPEVCWLKPNILESFFSDAGLYEESCCFGLKEENDKWSKGNTHQVVVDEAGHPENAIGVKEELQDCKPKGEARGRCFRAAGHLLKEEKPREFKIIKENLVVLVIELKRNA